MFQSSANLMAEDVTIRCRVRRSAFAANPDFNEAQEMTCTMRNWEKRGSFSRGPLHAFAMGERDGVDDQSGPELLLLPIVPILSNRSESPQRRQSFNSRRPKVAPVQSVRYNIPLAEILVVETCNLRFGASPHKLHMTTLTLGLFEFDCMNSNAHDILLAFLRASLAPERIIDGGALQKDKAPQVLKSSSSATSCLDIDGLTAQHLNGHIENETWPEKFSRRMTKVVSSLSEISGAFCEIACCRDRQMDEVRELPERTFRYTDLELDDGTAESFSTCPPPCSLQVATPATTTPKGKHKYVSLVSDGSLEKEPEVDARA